MHSLTVDYLAHISVAASIGLASTTLM